MARDSTGVGLGGAQASSESRDTACLEVVVAGHRQRRFGFLANVLTGLFKNYLKSSATNFQISTTVGETATTSPNRVCPRNDLRSLASPPIFGETLNDWI